MNIVHWITFTRIILIPLFPVCYLYHKWLHIDISIVPYILMIILLVCGISDFMDGIIARRRKLETDFGKIVDPMADVITHMSIFFTFTQPIVIVPLLIVFILLYRELIMSAFRTLCALKQITLGARKSGKIKTFTHFVVIFTILLLMIFENRGSLSLYKFQLVSKILVSFAAFFSVLSAIDYFYVHRQMLKRIFR